MWQMYKMFYDISKFIFIKQKTPLGVGVFNEHITNF